MDESVQPPPDVMKDGFSISAWTFYSQDTDGYVLAKTSADTVTQYYALKITLSSAQSSQSTVSFRYSLVGDQVTRNPNSLLPLECRVPRKFSRRMSLSFLLPTGGGGEEVGGRIHHGSGLHPPIFGHELSLSLDIYHRYHDSVRYVTDI